MQVFVYVVTLIGRLIYSNRTASTVEQAGILCLCHCMGSYSYLRKELAERKTDKKGKYAYLGHPHQQPLYIVTQLV